jgi:hypothetical protein
MRPLVISATLVSALLLALAVMAVAADNSFVGAWKMNLAKSKINSGPAPKREMVTFTAQDNGLKLVVDGIDSKGKAYHVAYAAKFDGKDYPLTGFKDADTIANDMAAIVFGEKYEIPRERVAIKLDPKLYDAYIGQYQLGPILILTITKESDRLMAEVAGQPKIELFPESETKFFFKVVDAPVTFVKDEQGQVTGLILYQGGEQRAKKIK